jgi:hypothetical protein
MRGRKRMVEVAGSRWRVVLVAAGFVAALGIGLASAGALEGRDEPARHVESEVLPVRTVPTTAEISDLNGGFPCPLIGRTAAEAIRYISALRFEIQWGLESPTSTDGDGYRSTPETVPMDSIVMDVSPGDANTVVVGVHAADDLTHNTPAPSHDRDC